jgi:eukaryotic-like serine/threonine-protein kinase
MLNPGTKLSNRYEILGPLGSGGMGVVYRARDLRLNREVAIKILPDHLLLRSDAMNRFDREAKALAALSHSCILSIFDFGTEQGISYAVMELLKGQTLREYLHKGIPPWKESVRIAEAIVDGLSAAHSQNVIHRDLKPENIFLTTDGNVKILDFGLARVEQPLAEDEDTTLPTATATQVGMVMGTLPYMSPEQLRGERIDPRTDIFSFGAMFYEMLTGTRAFAGTSHADTSASILKEDPISRGSFPIDLPVGVRQTLSRCLEKNASQRFQTSKDLAFALRMSESSARAEIIPPTTPPATIPSVASITPKPAATKKVLIAVILIAIAAAIAVYYFLPQRKEIQSLAVMPFVNGNRTNDPDADYLSDGITETLISSLSQVPKLTVMAHDTVFSYKGKPIDPRKVGRDLNVESILTGRVTRLGNTITIYANLVKVADGSELWGEQYNRTLSDIVSMPADISRDISSKLRKRLSGEEQNRVTKKLTENSEAYDLFLKGQFFFWKFTKEDYLKAREYFQQAFEKDPKFAEAWAYYSDTLSATAFEGYNPPAETIPQAKEAVERALAQDPSSGHAHISLGAIYLYEWNWPGAEAESKKGIELDPNRAENHRWYSQYLRSLKRWKEAIEEAKKARELDPLSVVMARTMGTTYYWAGQYELAIEQFKKALELDANRATIHDSLSDVYAKKGMFKEAIEEKQRLLALTGDENSAAELEENYHKYGYEQAKKILSEQYLEAYQEAAKEQYIPPLAFAALYTDLKEQDKAFEWLEKAYQEHSTWLVFLNTDPQFESLRSDPRFKDLVKRIGILH